MTTLRERLERRAALVDRIRAFMKARDVLEVSTPVLIDTPSAEPSLANLELARAEAPRFLRTSPESRLKVLLAGGSGDVFEIGPVYRAEEQGHRHLEEFTMLEWYRTGFDDRALMDETAALLTACGWCGPVRRLRYAEVFEACFGHDPHELSDAALRALATSAGVSAVESRMDRAMLFDALYVVGMEKALEGAGAVLLHDFPSALRAYAQLDSNTPPAARRFELVVDGLEIANGYFEIVDAGEQRRCFEAENEVRRARGLPSAPVDEAWLGALAQGVPPCAGAALGIERLLMTLGGLDDVRLANPAAENL